MKQKEELLLIEAQVLERAIEEIKYDINRTETQLRDLSIKSVGLLTVAGLISLLPFQSNSNFLKYYLIYIFPYLGFSIFTFFVAHILSKNIQRKAYPVAGGNIFEIINIIREQKKYMNEIWQKVVENYRIVSTLYKLTLISLVLFLTSFIVNFYLLNFGTLFNTCQNLLFNGFLILIGIFIYNLKKTIKHNKEIKIG